MTGIDEIFGSPTSWGLDYSVGRPGTDPQETQHVFEVGDVGESHAYADIATGTAYALTKNRLTPTFEAAEQVAEIVTKVIAES